MVFNKRIKNRKDKTMKKRFFELQLFAEEGTAEPDTKPADDTKKDDTKPAADPKKDDSQPKYTDADVDKLFEKKFAEWSKKKDAEVAEAKKLAEMNAKEKAEYERDKLQKELAAYKEKETLAEMSKTARKMLREEEITVSDELLAMMVSTNAENTKAAVDGFAKAFKEAVENAVKERLKGNPPKKGTGASAPAMTKAEIMAIKDPELRQQKMLENRELFNY